MIAARPAPGAGGPDRPHEADQAVPDPLAPAAYVPHGGPGCFLLLLTIPLSVLCLFVGPLAVGVLALGVGLGPGQSGHSTPYQMAAGIAVALGSVGVVLFALHLYEGAFPAIWL